jgi:hypothetical protein
MSLMSEENNMSKHIVTKSNLTERVLAGDTKAMHTIGRALVAIFNRQTEDEKGSNDTKYHNNMGFTGGDAKGGSLSAKYYLKHKRLEQWQVDRWTRRSPGGTVRIAKYWRQLDEVAKVKAASAKAVQQELNL